MSGAITGYTIQFGSPTIPCAKGVEDDREWFARHYGRNYRLRKPIGGEIAALELERSTRGVRPGWRPCMLVRQVEPGTRIRAACYVRRWPLNSETVASEMFAEITADDPWTAKVEALVREGKL